MSAKRKLWGSTLPTTWSRSSNEYWIGYAASFSKFFGWEQTWETRNDSWSNLEVVSLPPWRAKSLICFIQNTFSTLCFPFLEIYKENSSLGFLGWFSVRFRLIWACSENAMGNGKLHAIALKDKIGSLILRPIISVCRLFIAWSGEDVQLIQELDVRSVGKFRKYQIHFYFNLVFYIPSTWIVN